MRYSQTLLDYFFNLQHAGVLVGEDVLHAKMGAEKQGDVLSLYLKIKEKKIIHARFQAYGSVVLLAGSEYLCTWLEGKSKETALTLTPEAILTALALPLFKRHTAHLICRTLYCALEKIQEA